MERNWMAYRSWLAGALVLLAAGTLAFMGTPVASGAPAPPRITQIAAGGSHTCALTSGGGVMCWGHNQYGELGTGAFTNGGPTPVYVKGLASGVRAISSGFLHVCALTSRGGVKCWGFNHNGQLGSGSSMPKTNTPADVRGLTSGVSAIAAGYSHTCALTTAGGVKCWGSGLNGELGHGSRTGSNVPIDVVGLTSGVRAIAAGEFQTCAVTSGGAVKCWGGNPGNDTVRGCCTPTPVDVTGLASGVRSVAAGFRHACAVTSAGAGKCWGSNFYGQLGNGSRTAGRTPVDVVELGSGVSAFAGGQAHSCALTSTGGVKCWGFNRSGQVGNGSRGDFGPTAPVDVVGLMSGATAIAAGQAHTCALMSGGGVKCWGYNSAGQLGIASAAGPSSRPVDVVFPGTRAAPATPALRTFGGRIETHLRQLASGRTRLRNALAGVFNCSLSPRDAGLQVATVTRNRETILARLNGQSAPTAQAAQILVRLRRALSHSVAADRHYEAWLRYLQGQPRCSTRRNADFNAAQRQDRQATAAKRIFVAAYNPLARRLGLRTWSADEF
jgi:alpha-tubulin suppressor-like RCC1 family protein